MLGGVYIHIPFCASKCPYCDFYSFCADDNAKNDYVNALIDEIITGRRTREYTSGFIADTLYIGGGTPSVLKGEQLYRIIKTAKEKYKIPDGSEITVECNPASAIEEIAPFFKKAGVNRVSLGMQSAVDKERKTLGRKSDKERIKNVINILNENGISNISLDVMMGVPFQTKDTLKETLEFAVSSGAKHISSYILKLEEGTFFYNNKEKYSFSDDDEVCELYGFCNDFLKRNGFLHYEISNFALPGFESKHNKKYWLLDEYLGIGASSHSFVNGKRFYYDRSADDFINGAKPVFDGDGGSCEEYIMLRLRLKDGFSLSELKKLYGENSADLIIEKAPFFKEQGLVLYDGENISLTEKGYLLSNSVIAEFI